MGCTSSRSTDPRRSHQVRPSILDDQQLISIVNVAQKQAAAPGIHSLKPITNPTIIQIDEPDWHRADYGAYNQSPLRPDQQLLRQPTLLDDDDDDDSMYMSSAVTNSPMSGRDRTDSRHKRHHTLSPVPSVGKLHQFKDRVACLTLHIHVQSSSSIDNTLLQTAMIVRCRQIIQSLYTADAVHIQCEHELIYLLLEGCEAALKAALVIQQVVAQYNKQIQPQVDKRQCLPLTISGYGLDYGDVTQELPSNQLFGIASDCTRQLAVDIATGGQLLCTQRIKRELQGCDVYDAIEWQRREGEALEDNADALHDAMQGHYHACQPNRQHVEYPAIDDVIIAACDDATHIHLNLQPFASLYDPAMSRQQSLDTRQQLQELYVSATEVIVLAYNLHLDLITVEHSVVEAHTLKHAILSLLHPIVQLSAGNNVEDMMIVLPTAEAAVRCAVAMHAALANYNRTVTAESRVLATGFGVYSGEMLMVPATDVHWGPAYSMSKLLAEQLAADGEVLVSERVFDALPPDSELLQDVKVRKLHLETACKEQLTVYSVADIVTASNTASSRSMQLHPLGSHSNEQQSPLHSFHSLRKRLKEMNASEVSKSSQPTSPVAG